jgi:hypothetical protein
MFLHRAWNLRPTLRSTRRHWLTAALGGAAGLALGHRRLRADAVDDEIAQIEAHARKAGLGMFRSSVTEHYLGIGDAPDAYRNEALKRSEALAVAYLEHFQEKGLAVALPAQKLTAVTLKDRASYAAFCGGAPAAAVGGHYDLETNRLVIFDFRQGAAPPLAGAQGAKPNLERINSFTLSHETTHQLTFNTGLLDRKADVPLAVSEGLAMYAELWRPDGRSTVGMINRPRLGVLAPQANRPQDWIALERLLTDDALFQQAATEQLACAEAWVFVHYALRTTAMLPKFRGYLDVLRTGHAPAQRRADATGALGNLDRLNVELRKHARRLIP